MSSCPPRSAPRPGLDDNRVQHWRETGQRYSVAMWTAQLLAEFLRFVETDRLYARWWLIALRGLRRDDARTVAVLRAHRQRQLTEKTKVGETGYVFTGNLGYPLCPSSLTWRFRVLVKRAGLPPVRPHDLRHSAATLAHAAAGADLGTIQEQLGHTSIVLTADTYTSALMIRHFKIAEATARLVLTAATKRPGKMCPSAGQPTPADIRNTGGRHVARILAAQSDQEAQGAPRRGRTHMTLDRHSKIE